MKKELIVSVIAILAFLVLSLNVCVFASENTGFSNLIVGENVEEGDNTNTGNEQIEIVGNENTETANNTNEPGELANTGLEDLPWVVFGLLAILAVFTYRKVREYNAY